MPLMIVRQDITKMRTDAIVAAEGHDLGYHGWVGQAIADAAGPEYQKACENLGFGNAGEVKVTKGYDLPAKYVIHATGPRYTGGNNGEGIILSACYTNSLKAAEELGCESIAFSLISTGGYGFPKAEGLKIATQAIYKHLKKSDMNVYLVVFDRESLTASRKLMIDIEEYIDDNYVNERKVDLRALQTMRSDDRPLHRRIRRRIEEDEDVLVCGSALPSEANAAKGRSLESVLKERDESFQQMLFRLIVEKDLKNSEVYTSANMSKSHFSKIKNDPDYRPKKETVFALAVALRLNIAETNELMKKAGFSISHSFLLDTIVEYFIVNGKYNIIDINIALFDHDQPLLGERAL